MIALEQKFRELLCEIVGTLHEKFTRHRTSESDEPFVKGLYPQARISPIQSTPGYLDLFFMVELYPGKLCEKQYTPEEAWAAARHQIEKGQP